MKKTITLVCALTLALSYGTAFSTPPVKGPVDVNVVNLVKLSSENYRVVGGNPFTIADGQVTGQTGCLSLTLISHPQVIVEYFSCSAKAPAGQALIFGLETAMDASCSGPFQYYLPVTPTALATTGSSISLSAGQQVRITVNQNGYVRFTATRTGGTSGDVEVNCFVDGFANMD